MAYKWRAAIITAVGLFMAVLDNTIVNVALPQMRVYFHTSLTTIQWVATAYFLAQAAIIPIVGYLSDRIGSKAVFLGALAIFTIGSGLCFLAPNEVLLIVFRVFQGIGGGALFPVVFALIFRVFLPRNVVPRPPWSECRYSWRQSLAQRLVAISRSNLTGMLSLPSIYPLACWSS